MRPSRAARPPMTLTLQDEPRMPITTLQGDIFTSHAHTLVNPVNCRGVMGRGLAREFAVR